MPMATFPFNYLGADRELSKKETAKLRFRARRSFARLVIISRGNLNIQISGSNRFKDCRASSPPHFRRDVSAVARPRKVGLSRSRDHDLSSRVKVNERIIDGIGAQD